MSKKSDSLRPLKRRLDAYSEKSQTTMEAPVAKQWRNWLPFTAAAAAAAVAPPAADATIIYSNPTDIVVGPQGSAQIDMNGGGHDLSFGNIASGGGGYSYRAAFLVGRNGAGIVTFRLGSSEGLPGSRSFGTSSVKLRSTLVSAGIPSEYGPFAANSAGFIGVRLADGDFGWIRIRVASNGTAGNSGFTTTIFDWAYEDSGQPIHIPDTASVPNPGSEVPEPSTVSLVGLGALALGARGVRKLRSRQERAT